MIAPRHLRLAVALVAACVFVVMGACTGEEPGHDEGIAETADAIRSSEVVRGYKLPFSAGTTYSIVQYPHGYRDQIWNAVDVGIPRGGDVLAMKAGKVSAVIDTFADYAPGYVCNWAACNDATNFVIIQHDDGQESSYLHLAKKSVSALGIAPGTRVCQGQVIGKVGHNGYSFGPHTHVSVQAGGSAGDRAHAWNAMWSKPTKVIHFDDVKGEIAQGGSYRSQNAKSCGGTTGGTAKDAGAAGTAAKDAGSLGPATKDAGATDAGTTDAEGAEDGGGWTNAPQTLETQGEPETPAPEGSDVGGGAREEREIQANAGCTAAPRGDTSGATFLPALALALALVLALVRSRRRRCEG